MLADEGLDNVWWRHEVLGGAVRAAIEAWSQSSDIEFNIEDSRYRSNAVTTVLTGNIDADRLRSLAEKEAGLVLGLALGGFEGRAFRIGHMGHLNPPMLLGTLGTIESVLIAMGVSLSASGVSAAAGHIGKSLITT
jgi:alanine-glyoxylate transaminase/serine-glyoxylate transaminase/serine-pyruvate transaminase